MLKEKALKYFKMSRKGIFAFAFIFFILTIVITITFAILIPLTININSQLYNTGKEIIENINTTEYPPELQESFQKAEESFQFSLNIMNYLVRYSWLIAILIIAIVLFIWARMTVEYPQVR